MSDIYATTDICDDYGDAARVLDGGYQSFGKRKAFHGPVRTLKCFEDNSHVRAQVEQPGEGRVLVVDGGGSLRCALFGGNLAKLAANNGWAGVVIYGTARDADELDAEDVGVKALGLCPRKSNKQGNGELDIPVTFSGQTIKPTDYLYADRDGIVVADGPLHQ